MTKSEATDIRDHALAAIRSLSRALAQIDQQTCPYDEYMAVKRGVGASIGMIQIELLETIYKTYPELDETK